MEGRGTHEHNGPAAGPRVKVLRCRRAAADLARLREYAEALRRAAAGEDGRGILDAGLRRDLRRAPRAAAQGLATVFALLHASRTDEDARGRR
jgi:hypothetical protein